MATKMTPQERAEKILAFVDAAKTRYLYSNESCFDFIAAQIEEAEQKVLAESMKIADQISTEAYTEGWNAAREKAKAIALSWNELESEKDLADRIGKIEP